jgi:hypothetical protein
MHKFSLKKNKSMHILYKIEKQNVISLWHNKQLPLVLGW